MTPVNFRVIAKGASGGHGRLSRKSSHGAIIKAIIKLKRGFCKIVRENLLMSVLFQVTLCTFLLVKRGNLLVLLMELKQEKVFVHRW